MPSRSQENSEMTEYEQHCHGYYFFGFGSCLGKNEKVSDYEELYHGDLKEQIYVSRLLKENFDNRVPDN